MSKTLPELSLARLGSLGEAEYKLFHDLAQNGKAFCEGNEISASCLEWLCNSKEAKGYLTDQGIQIRNAIILGDLKLNYICLDKPFIIQDSTILGRILLNNAELHTLELYKTRIEKDLNADGLFVHYDLILRHSKICDNVRLSMASIGGDLNCRQCEIVNKSKDQFALKADGAEIGAVHLGGHSESDRFVSNGEVCFANSHIKSVLECSYSLFKNLSGNALSAYNAKINGNVFVDKAKLEGKTSLSLACIDGDLSFRGSVLEVQNNDDLVLSLNAANIASSLFLDEKFSAFGTVDLTNAKVINKLRIKKVNRPKTMCLNLQFAHVGILEDDAQNWPEDTDIRLNGFEYKIINRDLPKNEKAIIDGHLRWLRMQDKEHRTYKAYDVLSTALRYNGKVGIARKIQLHKRRDYRKFEKLNCLNSCWEKLLDCVVGYGYYPEKSIMIGIFFVALGFLVFSQAHQRGLITAAAYSEIEVYQDENYDVIDTNTLDVTYPRFNAFVYSVDTFIPLIDLQQDRYWHVNTTEIKDVFCFASRKVCLNDEWVRCYLRGHIFVGWLVTSLIVAVLAGFVKKQES